MGISEIILLAVSLSMDAFAVALCKGLALKKIDIKSCLTVGCWFGSFQGLMPLIGFLLGSTFADKITSVDHWIAFILLAIIGANMIKEALSKEEECVNCSLGAKAMLGMAIATSIDALAVGVSFAFTDFEPDWFVYVAFVMIGVITMTLSAIGVKIGNIFGTKYKSKAEFAGGAVLILLGLKILLEGLGILK
ncbi:MAG: manganese efflux pump [Ruminococcaceae bacterium]|nr:manganese efflux pump [Oscillospiraceae bacterium]